MLVTMISWFADRYDFKMKHGAITNYDQTLVDEALDAGKAKVKRIQDNVWQKGSTSKRATTASRNVVA